MNTTPKVILERTVPGSGNSNTPYVYSCEGYRVTVRRPNLESDFQVKVESPEGDPNDAALAELFMAILRDQRRAS